MTTTINKTNLIRAGIFLLYLIIFFTIDYLNMPYTQMIQVEGIWVTLIHILLNFVMASLALYLYMLQEDMISLIGKETRSSNASVISAVFGMLTYGCTPCVISFFAAIGIQFSIVALPWAGLPYKLISLGILLLGIYFTKRQQSKACQIN